MGTKGAQCLSLLEDCLALQLQRAGGSPSLSHHDTHHYWVYDSGYLLYQGFVEANLKCRWDPGLTAAVRGLQFRGYVSPGILLVGGSQPALHLLRAAWSRRVLKPPPSYVITLLGDVEDCTVSKVQQTSFTPLSDAVCWVILQLGTSGQNAVLDSIQSNLNSTFPEIEQPSRHLLYDTLADLMSENKIYQTAQGYFISNQESNRGGHGDKSGRQVLLTHEEAAAMASGEIVTIREGAKTHQAIQTNLADVICGGNKSDRVMYARAPVRTPGRKLERRHSMRLLGSSRRLSTLHRAGSVRLLHNNSGTENNQKKCSLFSKLFKWSKRQNPATNSVASALSMSFPPHEWFNSTVLGLHSVGTQTKTFGRGGDGDWSECGSVKSRRRSLSTSRLPRRQTRPPSESPSRPSPSSTPTSSKTALTNTPKALSSASSGYNSLPRSSKSKSKLIQSNSSTSRLANGNSIKVELSASPSSITADTKVDTHMTASINDPSATMTTTINGPNSTKIFVQQQNSPIRSVITFEKSRKPYSDKIKDDADRNERSSKIDQKRFRRPSSLYQQRERESVKESLVKNNVNVEHLSNNIKMKFPSTETIIQMEEKLLISGKNNNTNECQKRNVFDPLKTGSLIDVAELVSDSRMNNVRKASASLTPLQPALSTDKVLESLSYKNVLKESQMEPLTKKDGKNNCYTSNNKLQLLEKTIEVSGKKVESRLCSFPSLSDLSLHFTSIAAQNILNGVSINSLDTLVESNEKITLKDITIHTDKGVV